MKNIKENVRKQKKKYKKKYQFIKKDIFFSLVIYV